MKPKTEAQQQAVLINRTLDEDIAITDKELAIKKIESEKVLERKLVDKIKKLGGHAYKFVSPNQRGVPDRLCVLPHGITVFVELKTTGKKPTKLQVLCMDELKALGQECVVVDSSRALDELINRLSNFIKALEPAIVSAKDIQAAMDNYSGREELRL